MLTMLDNRTAERRQSPGRRRTDAVIDLRDRLARPTDAEFARRYAEALLRVRVSERLRDL